MHSAVNEGDRVMTRGWLIQVSFKASFVEVVQGVGCKAFVPFFSFLKSPSYDATSPP